MRGATRATCTSIAAQRSSSAAASLAPSRVRDAASSDERLADELVHERGERFGRERRLGEHAGPAQDFGDRQRRGAGSMPLHVGCGLREVLAPARRIPRAWRRRARSD